MGAQQCLMCIALEVIGKRSGLSACSLGKGINRDRNECGVTISRLRDF